ncbi:TrgA family protein [Tateyamaria sp. SN6-1]|uniref:TrgA family protein n=1 Tax=Tateyamaria sp. SN6-1 TaxID=3092148 RepID=UPI0039F61062
MPDAAKLVGALGLAILGFVLSGMIMTLFEEDTNFGWFVHVNVLLGIAVGWVFIGRRMGRGWTSAVNVGLTGGVVLVFWGLFIQAANEMVGRAMKNRYDGAGEALLAIMEIGAEWAFLMSTPLIWGTVVAGGLLTGLLAEFAWRTWR